MSKPRRSLQQEWYDVFADWDLVDQAIALRMITEINRQATRHEKRRPSPDIATAIVAEIEQGETEL